MKKIPLGGSPFTEVHHVGIIVSDVEKTAEYYGTFKVGPFELVQIERKERLLYGNPIEDLNLKVMQTHVGPIRVELVQPIGGDEYLWMQTLKTRGEGIAHIAFVVDDLDKEEVGLAEAGVEAFWKARYYNGGSVAYFDTSKIGGVTFELIQRPSGYVPSNRKDLESVDSPFRNVFQIGTIVKDLDKTREYYEFLGIGPWGEGPSAAVINRRIYGKPAGLKVRGAIGMIGDIELEIMQPIEGESIQVETLWKKGEGGIHINARPDDMDKEKARVLEMRFPIISSGEMHGRASGEFAYFDTRKYAGTIWELERK